MSTQLTIALVLIAIESISIIVLVSFAFRLIHWLSYWRESCIEANRKLRPVAMNERTVFYEFYSEEEDDEERPDEIV